MRLRQNLISVSGVKMSSVFSLNTSSPQKTRLWAIPNTMPTLLVGHSTVEAIAAALSEAAEEAAAELRPFDAEALKSKSIAYATMEPEEEGMEG